ncbi:Hypothetical protein I595_147 [Croceitalea dokdonensis DOKDO 023]|uniref:Uncharacterized protein n=1 Tax=Croceitalea dokdonensis DOKDO 023 TaxID=1300341 RepID=A0A0N8H4F7_9FLAO|nr:Hypothetical protein I595_147 [Croceitalea dokdonensis DOKDO 023]
MNFYDIIKKHLFGNGHYLYKKSVRLSRNDNQRRRKKRNEIKDWEV